MARFVHSVGALVRDRGEGGSGWSRPAVGVIAAAVVWPLAAGGVGKPCYRFVTGDVLGLPPFMLAYG